MSLSGGPTVWGLAAVLDWITNVIHCYSMIQKGWNAATHCNGFQIGETLYLIENNTTYQKLKLGSTTIF